MKCPHCRKEIPIKEYAVHFARLGGRVKCSTEKQKEAARINGKLGGRPKGAKNKPKGTL